MNDMDVFYDSDWHIHSEASYDADLKVPNLIESAKKNGIKQFGITDHVNYPFMVKHLERSRDLFLAIKLGDFILALNLRLYRNRSMILHLNIRLIPTAVISGFMVIFRLFSRKAALRFHCLKKKLNAAVLNTWWQVHTGHLACIRAAKAL